MDFTMGNKIVLPAGYLDEFLDLNRGEMDFFLVKSENPLQKSPIHLGNIVTII